MIWLLLLLLVVGVLGAWFLADATQTELSAVRKAANPRLVTLPAGVTRADWHGDVDGPVLVCIHGLSTASHVWGPLVPLLVDQGYRVLTYDLFGRGLSDRVPGPQTREFFLRQFRQLLEAEGVEGPVTLVGYSMGGQIAAARAVEAPDHVARLILLAPAGLGFTPGRIVQLATEIPVLGDWVQAVVCPVVQQWNLMRATGTSPEVDAVLAETAKDLRVDGTMAGLLSSQRNLLSEGMIEDHRSVARSGVPLVVLWGEVDAVIPACAMGRLAQINRTAIQHQVAGAGHALPYTHAAEVAREIGETL